MNPQERDDATAEDEAFDAIPRVTEAQLDARLEHLAKVNRAKLATYSSLVKSFSYSLDTLEKLGLTTAVETGRRILVIAEALDRGELP